MNLWRSLSGLVEVEVTTADPEGICERLTESGITLEQFHQRSIM